MGCTYGCRETGEIIGYDDILDSTEQGYLIKWDDGLMNTSARESSIELT